MEPGRGRDVVDGVEAPFVIYRDPDLEIIDHVIW